MSDDWRNEFATEEQKEKLRFFGCTWCGDITMGKASDALEECAKQFPGIEAAYKNRPITDDQLDELRSLGQEPVREFTYDEAMELIESVKTRNAKRREDAAAIFQNETNAKVETSLHPDAPQIAGENLPPIIDRYPLESQNVNPLESTIQEAGTEASHAASCSSRRNRWNPISSTMACKCRACINIFPSS
jgi:DNA-directed RNA polymerase subunit M/transcription elongation factor TFIIS